METTSVWLLAYLKPAMKTGWAVTSQNWVINKHPITYCGNSTPPRSSCFGCAGLQLTRRTRLKVYWWGMRTHTMKNFGWSRGSNGIASSSIDGAGDPEKEKLTKWLLGWIFWGTASKRECCFQFCSAASALVKSYKTIHCWRWWIIYAYNCRLCQDGILFNTDGVKSRILYYI